MARKTPPDRQRGSGSKSRRAKYVRSRRSLLFEVAWEVCRQVGGIYTVIRSKVPEATKTWKERYCLIGPWDPASSPLEFETGTPEGPIAKAVEALSRRGFEVHYGTWLITGRPQVVLISPASPAVRLDQAKYFLWKHQQIDCGNDVMVSEVVAFAQCVEEFFAELIPHLDDAALPVAHFHEWMAGAAIPALRRRKMPLATVFTTHATLLGRYLASNDGWFYDHVPFVDWLADARRFSIEAKVRLERAAAHDAHVFTTLSEVTDYECEHLLGRKADLLTPNGLNIERFVALHEFQNLHREYRERIRQFVMAHFFPSYRFDLDKTLFFLTSGRYEYRNKGFDLTLEALARLNAQMRVQRVDRTVVFFLITRRPYDHIHPEVLNSRAVMEEMRHTCREIQQAFGEQLFLATTENRDVRPAELLDERWWLRLQRLRHAWRAHRLPLVVTHQLVDNDRDEVLNQLRYLKLINQPDSPVKVVYHPEFVSATDPVFGLEYDQFTRGCHLGVFPSFYEPWGYTPQECAARGVPAITSDVSGFGTYLMNSMSDHASRGLYVVHRRMHTFDVAAEELAGQMMAFLKQDRRQRIDQRNRVERSMEQFDWSRLCSQYNQAHELAIRAVFDVN